MRKKFTNRNLLWSFMLLFAGTLNAGASDAGMTGIINPAGTVCTGSHNIRAVIQNFGGADTITSATIDWTVNGAAQPTFNFSGSIAPGEIDTVTLGSFPFVTGTTNSIVVFSSNPNGAADDDTSNDTASTTTMVMLSGIFSIGGSNPNFADFDSAITALTTYGICGPVVFNIRPGSDTIQAVIPYITGSDSANTILFQAETGDSSSVILTYPSQPGLTATNYLIRLDGGSNITFRFMTFQRSGIEPYARVIEFTNNASNNTVSNCRFIGSTNAITNSLAALIYSSAGSSTNDSMNSFSNNLFMNGSIGIYMNGVNAQNLEQENEITNNIFSNQTSKGIQLSNQGLINIRGNEFTTSSTYAGYAAMYLDRCQRNHTVTRNKITGVPGTGIYMVDCTAFLHLPGRISNNFIQCNDSAGISVVGGAFQNIVYNSVHMTGTDPSYAALFMHGSTDGFYVRNNILANTGGGFAYVVTDSAIFGLTTSDYNNFYATGTNIGNWNGTNITSINTWIATAQRDTNSLNVDPGFLSPTDLHSTAVAMDDRGAPFPGVTEDIDGETRSTVTPDIGADEYSSISHTVGVTAIITPADGDCGDSTTTFSVVISNTGGFVESNFPVVADITGAVTTTLNEQHTASLQPGASDTLTFTTTVNTAAGGVLNVKIYTSLSNDDIPVNDTLQTTINLFVQPAPPTLTVGDSICGSGFGTLTAVSLDTLIWFTNATGGLPVDTGAPFTTPNLNATTTFYVAAKNGCFSDRLPVTATVLPLPAVLLGPDTTVLQGDTFTFDAGAGFATYLWSTGDTTQTMTTGLQDCYDVTVTNNFGCANSDTVCLTLILPFDVGVTAIAAPVDGACADSNQTVDVVVENLGSNTALNIPVTVTISGTTSASFTDTVPGPIVAGDNVTVTMGSITTVAGGSYVITAYTSYGGDQDHFNDTIDANIVTVHSPAPPVGLGGSRCGAGPLVISASGSDTIYWYDAANGGNLLFVGNSYSIPSLTQTTTFYAQAGNVCPGQARTPVTATVIIPAVDLGNDTIVSDSLILDAGAGFVSYTWNTGDTTQTVLADSTGIYIVTVVDTNGCTNSDTVEVTIFTGIGNAIIADRIGVYPNPASNEVTLNFTNTKSNSIDIRFLTVQGEIVRNYQLRFRGQDVKQTFDISGLPAGMYFIEMVSDAGIESTRLIVN